jgi:hypothetical protein
MSFCLWQRPLAPIAFAAFIGVGHAVFTALNVGAYPDPAPPIIEIIAQYPGQSRARAATAVPATTKFFISSSLCWLAVVPSADGLCCPSYWPHFAGIAPKFKPQSV